MRRFLIMSLILLTYSSASAQQYYAAQEYPAPLQTAPQSVPDTIAYAGQPAYAPQYPSAPQPQVAPQHPQAQQPVQPQPWDYGHSVTTDIRQMNF